MSQTSDTHSSAANLGGIFTPAGTAFKIRRFGYGAMQLAGPHVFGPPKDRAAAVAVLREAIALGVNHIDTSDFYGPFVTNQIIRKALHPYPEDLVIVTKVGWLRGEDGSWNPAKSKTEITEAVHSNLRNLGLDALDIVNLRIGGMAAPAAENFTEPFEALVALQQQGLIRHLGMSNMFPAQYAEAKAMAPIVCVQNNFNLAHRGDDAFISQLATDGVAFVPYFPLGGFTPLQSSALDEAARKLGAPQIQVALAWLHQHAPNILLIPGTSSVAHLRENLAAATLEIPADVLEALNGIGNADTEAAE